MLQNIRDAWQRAGQMQRLILIVMVLACIGAAVLLSNWAGKPDLAMLYTGLSPEEAAKMVEKINESQTPYELRNGGTAIYVAQDKVYTLRLQLAGEGMPSGDQPGYRILDDEKIGTSPFTQQINYRRALEGEIARSIQLIQGVQSARLHIVKPDTQVFAKTDKLASATVFLRLKPGWRMQPSNVAAIVHLVAGSIDGLRPENVVVVDSGGNLLSGEAQQGLAKGANTLFAYKTQVEEYYARKVEDMLTAVLGPNRASVRVSAVVDSTSSTMTKEVYDPAA
jgi:flagellar M-ring protein FliF